MKNIVYLSSAVKLMTDEQLVDLLKVARKNNDLYKVSGVLLYADGVFLQVLEGEDADVELIFSKIKSDRRHQTITTLIDEPIESREFGSWAMGFASVNPTLTSNLTAYLKAGQNLNFKDGRSAAVSTIKTFIDHNELKIDY